jgi:hypothetical protein
MEVNMKKKVTFLLIAIFILSLTACGGEGAAVTGSGWGEGEDSVPAGDAPDSPDALDSSNVQGDSQSPANDRNDIPDMSVLTINPSAASGQSLKIPDMWITEHGAYYVHITQPEQDTITRGSSKGGRVSVMGAGMEAFKHSALLYIIDSRTGRDMVLCNRITCTHDSEDCGAYLPDDPLPDFEGDGFAMVRSVSFRGGFGNNPCLFVEDDYIYAMNSGNTMYRFNLDGSGRTEHMKIPDEYEVSHWGGNHWLMNGKLYMSVIFMVQTGEFGFASVSALLEVDYINKTVKEVWKGEPSDSMDGSGWFIDTLGLWNGNIYVMKTYYPPFNHSGDADMMEYYNNQQIKIVTINPATGAESEILSETGDTFSSNFHAISDEGEFYFFSRREQSLFRFNVITGQRTLLSDKLPGFMFIQEKRDGRLMLIRDYLIEDDMEYDQLVVSSGIYFYDFNTGEVGEITLRTRQNIGDDVPMYILFEEDGYYYVEAEREMVEQTSSTRGGVIYSSVEGVNGLSWYIAERTLLGRIPIDDYWANNASAIEELDWYEENEWWEMLSEKQNWRF